MDPDAGCLNFWPIVVSDSGKGAAPFCLTFSIEMSHSERLLPAIYTELYINPGLPLLNHHCIMHELIWSDKVYRRNHLFQLI